MEDKPWKYKIGSGKMPVILTSLMFAAFGGFTAWLYSTENGAFIFTGLFSAILLALVFATGYRLAFFKVLIGKDGFYYQTGPGNGRLYRYIDIKKAWVHSGEAQNRSQEDYCNIETVTGQVIRFQFFYADEKAVNYLIKIIEAAASKGPTEQEREKDEYVIDGKVFSKTRIVIGIVILLVVAIIDLVILKATGHLYLAVPGTVMALFILVYLINSNRYFLVKIESNGFYCRTNPFNGRYYKYCEIAHCRRIKKVVYHRYHVGDSDLPSYFFYFEFTDRNGKKRRFQFEDPIHGHEVNVLKERIEKAKA